MSDAVCNDVDSEALDIDDRLVPALAIAHYAWQLKSLRDPASIFLDLQINRQILSFIIPLQRERRPARVVQYKMILKMGGVPKARLRNIYSLYLNKCPEAILASLN
jgi:hypothetical protein